MRAMPLIFATLCAVGTLAGGAVAADRSASSLPMPALASAGGGTPAPAWNFEKYLVGADGKVVGRFGSGVTPESAELASAIERLLR
jgi:glutathione peroxidase-family protein